MKKIFCCLLLNAILIWIQSAKAQPTLIVSENFEGNSFITELNVNELGTNSGINQWVINSSFDGGGIYPNTISQDSTFGGFITPLNLNYLHIHDSMATLNGIANANFNPLEESDRLAIINEFCTLGFSNVTTSLYYLCVGDSNNAYGEAFYSVNNGPWVPFTGAVYRNTYKWKYTELSDPALDNKSNVRIGFRWINNAVNTPYTPSFAIDDIKITGIPNAGNFVISIDSLKQVPVCKGATFQVFFSFNNQDCNDGFYQVILSNAAGVFVNTTNLGTYQLSNQQSTHTLYLVIPSTISIGSCYKIKINRTDIVPFMQSNESDCFEVIDCPNTISTLQPVMLTNPTDTICVGSVLDVPFNTTGVFTNATFRAELSDASGNFSLQPNVLGYLAAPNTFPFSVNGIIKGLLFSTFDPIVPSCNYYIRVVSNTPYTVGSLYGPFCIKNCDLQFNNQQDIQACINAVSGYDSTAVIDINHVNLTNALYSSGNNFQIQVLNGFNYNIVNTGAIGLVSSTTDTVVPMNIPNIAGLSALGVQPGNYYARIVATNSSTPWNSASNIVRLAIGAPESTPLQIYSYNPLNFTGYNLITDTIICQGGSIYFAPSTSNPSSTYTWSLNQNFWSNDNFIGILFNSPNTYQINVLETNFGCVGPGSDTALVIVPVGPPTNIFGSSSVIMLDTCIYNVSGIANANYFWTCNNANIIQNNNHECKIIFPSTGTYQLKCNYGATCDSVILVKNIYVSSGLGMDDFLNQSGIALMNNISEGIFQIFSNRNNGSVFLSVYQIDGKLVTHRLTYPITVDSAYNLDLSSLKSGVYYLKIDIDNLSKTFKIVKI